MKSIRCFSKFPLTEAVMVKWRLITHNENTPHDRTENPAAVFIHRTGRNSWLLPSLFVAQGGQIHLAAFSCRYLPGDIRLAFVFAPYCVRPGIRCLWRGLYLRCHLLAMAG